MRPQPGAFKARGGDAAEAEGAGVMKADVTTLEASKAGTVELEDAIFGLEPRPDLIQRMVRYQLLKRHGRHASRPGPFRSERHGQEDVQAEGHRRRPSRRQVGAAVARRRQGVRPQAAQPCHRAAEEGARARSAPCAVGQGQGRRDRRARQGGMPRTARPRRLREQFAKLELDQRADHRRRGARSRASPAPPATSPTSMCCRCRASTSTTSCAAGSWC